MWEIHIWGLRCQGSGLGWRLRGLEDRGRALGTGSEGPRHGGGGVREGSGMRLGDGFGEELFTSGEQIWGRAIVRAELPGR